MQSRVKSRGKKEQRWCRGAGAEVVQRLRHRGGAGEVLKLKR